MRDSALTFILQLHRYKVFSILYRTDLKPYLGNSPLPVFYSVTGFMLFTMKRALPSAEFYTKQAADLEFFFFQNCSLNFIILSSLSSCVSL